MLSRLRKVAALLGHDGPGTVPRHELRYQHTEAIRAKLQDQGEAPATVNLALCGLRRIARAALNMGLMDSEEYQRVRNVESVRRSRLLRGRALTSGEIEALMDAHARDEGPAGVRDAAAIAVLYACGLRRAEVVALSLADYDREKGELIVRGKGNRERNLFLDNGAFDGLADGLEVRGDEPGPVFVPIDKAGQIGSGQITAQAVYKMLKKRAGQAQVKDFSPHDLRRSFISDQLDAGTDIVTVQSIAGHASPSTTAKYDRRGDEAKKRAAKALHVPWRRKATEQEGREVSICSRVRPTPTEDNAEGRAREAETPFGRRRCLGSWASQCLRTGCPRTRNAGPLQSSDATHDGGRVPLAEPVREVPLVTRGPCAREGRREHSAAQCHRPEHDVFRLAQWPARTATATA